MAKRNDNYRCFAAIQPDLACLKDLYQCSNRLQTLLATSPVRWMPADNWHITLKFFGDTPLRRLPELIEALEQASDQAPFSLNFTHCDWFPSAEKPSVLACLTAPDEQLAQLASSIQKQTSWLTGGQHKPYRGHLTLARPKARKVAPLLETLVCSAVTRVTSFNLYRSHLTSQGARYELLQEFLLKG